ncbi:MAG: hypothetical protein WC684_06865, partial [Hyphomicrobium sp.]
PTLDACGARGSRSYSFGQISLSGMPGGAGGRVPGWPTGHTAAPSGSLILIPWKITRIECDTFTVLFARFAALFEN